MRYIFKGAVCNFCSTSDTKPNCKKKNQISQFLFYSVLDFVSWVFFLACCCPFSVLFNSHHLKVYGIFWSTGVVHCKPTWSTVQTHAIGWANIAFLGCSNTTDITTPCFISEIDLPLSSCNPPLQYIFFSLQTLNKNNLLPDERTNYFPTPLQQTNVYTTTYYPTALGKYDYRPDSSPSPCRTYNHSWDMLAHP